MNAITIQHELFAAVAAGNLPLIEALLREGADINAHASDPDQETPLLRAIAVGDLNVVRALLEAGANVNAAGVLTGMTPIMRAIGKTDILRELISKGANINARAHANLKASTEFAEPSGKTALHLSAAANNAVAIEILAAAGANLELPDEAGQSALDIAIKGGTPTRAALALMEAGAQVTPEQRRWMHSAAAEPESYLKSEHVNPRVADLIRRASLAKEFSERPRPAFKAAIFFYFVLSATFYVFISKTLNNSALTLDPRAFLIPLAAAALAAYRTWKEANPICPGCKENIRLCPSTFCHVCGQRRQEGGRCQACGPAPDALLLKPSRNAQDLQPIFHCPNCSAYLDSGLYRGYSRRRGLFRT